MDDIRTFQIHVDDADLNDLNDRLARTRWPETEPVDDWTQGIPLQYVQELCGYWQTEYNWRSTEEALNNIPQYMTEIDGLDIHFLHLKSPVENAMPLVLTHGWPGSIIEFMKVLGPLSDPEAHGGTADDAFHLVVPTLPGFGFSGKPTSTGWGVDKVADAWSQLMRRLGYQNYFAQGGDWGSAVTASIGIQDSEHCAGIHTNMPMAAPSADQMKEMTALEEKAIQARQFYQDWDSGYSKQQSTRPQTLGYGLVDSPAG
ncbi:MAG: epoxide hydrolase, partial [Pseudomonadota bacterium]|nr:epoxide hydrolase [Pseudomonadota bacterium]